MSEGLGESRYIFAKRPSVNIGNSIAPIDLARISAVDCELPRRLGGVIDEGKEVKRQRRNAVGRWVFSKGIDSIDDVSSKKRGSRGSKE